MHGRQRHGAIRARGGRREKLDEGGQPVRGTYSLDSAHDDAITADRQRIALVLGFSTRGNTDRRRQEVEVGAAAKLDADGRNIVGKCDRRALNPFELEPDAAGNVPAKTINDRLASVYSTRTPLRTGNCPMSETTLRSTGI